MIDARLKSCSKRPLRFGDLHIGDVFFNDNGELFIAIEPIEGREGEIYNAAYLSDGEVVLMNDREEVRKINKPLIFDYTLDDIVDSTRD